ncbi:hypothetical protein GIB67_043202 [Kingdonia uniflora]|uniref:Uncharacterized protein n=1 Tax=Kingdonia uniflora TaxID=39325 RepID=A0A7J7NJB7_9MAGN|nr:hypothetical protein GIB67_043202 [Kingdonia uniflora]
MDPSSNAGEPTNINMEFPEQPKESCAITVPLILHPSFSQVPSKSCTYEELHRFRISLKWCALDHSSWIGKFVSYFVFVILTVVVPLVSSVAVRVPDTHTAEDPIAFNKLVQLPESGLAAIGFFTLSCFFGRYGLCQLLFLDGLRDDSLYVRHEYARELKKAFKHVTFILLPSFFVELTHKVMFFSIVTVSVPHIPDGVPSNSIMFIAVLASWVYRTGVFLVVCVLFRLTCELQILRFEGFKKMFEGYGSESGVIFQEHIRIRKQLSVTSHRYRVFIIMSWVSITVSKLGALLLVLASKSKKNFFNSGDLVVCSAVELSGFFFCLLGAARITHRTQKVVSIASRWHMLATSLPLDMNPNLEDSTCAAGLESTGPLSHDTLPFHTRQALVSYLQHNNSGITLFGFALDRRLLYTLFVFESSLVLWILSKVISFS